MSKFHKSKLALVLLGILIGILLTAGCAATLNGNSDPQTQETTIIQNDNLQPELLTKTIAAETESKSDWVIYYSWYDRNLTRMVFVPCIRADGGQLSCSWDKYWGR